MLRVQLLVVTTRGQPQRVELGVEVAAHAVGADQHDRPHRILRRLLDGDAGRGQHAAGDSAIDRLTGKRVALLLLGNDLVADGLLQGGPIAVHSRDQLAVQRNGPVRPLPRSARGVLLDQGLVLAERLEEILPLGIDGVRIARVGGLQFLDVGSVRAVQERGFEERFVHVLACHGASILSLAAGAGARPLGTGRAGVRKR